MVDGLGGARGRVLVTGANGFMGRIVCAGLPPKGFSPVAAVRKIDPDICSDLDGACEVGSICSDTDWSNVLDGVDAVVHLAARAHVLQEYAADPLGEFRMVNCEGTLGLARQMARAGAKRLVFISSIGVNGNLTAGRPFREDDSPNPQEPYAVSKWEAEQGLVEIARETGLELVIIRPPLCYGPGAKGNFQRMMAWLAKGVPLPLAMVHNRRSLLNMENLVDLIAICLDHPAAAGQLFLASDGQDLSTSGLIRELAAAMGLGARLLPVPPKFLEMALAAVGKRKLATQLLGSLQVDNTKARELLGWHPAHSVEQGLTAMAESFNI